MREKIILAPSANSTELLRFLARHGKNQLGTRIFSPAELAESALMRSGITVKEKFLRNSEASSLIFSFLSEIDYFSSASFSDAQNIVSALNSVRNLITANESETIRNVLSKGEFKDKNAALINVYDRYISALKSDGYIDGIQLVRLAAERCEAIESEFIVLKEFPLTPLENKLAEKLSGGNFWSVSLCDLLEIPGKSVLFSDITEAYGISNEVEKLIGTIYENNLPIDRCTVAVTDTAKYSQLIFDAARQYNIPVTFGCGLPITNSRPAILLRHFHIWETSGYHGIDALRSMIFCGGFDRKKLCEALELDKEYKLYKLIEIAGNLRLSCDSEINQKRITDYRSTLAPDSIEAENLALAGKMADEFAHGCSYIIRNYSANRKNDMGKIDRSAVSAICNELDAYSKFSDIPTSAFIPDILQKNVCTENSTEGCLHVTGIGQAVCSLRENLFVMGLSAGNFPGSPTENYLVLDKDYLLFGNETPTSENVILKRKKALLDLLKTASSLDNPIHLSYSGYDTAELKEENASSVLFELFKSQSGENSDMNDFKKSISHTGFFSQKISASRLIGNAYNNGDDIVSNHEEIPEKSVKISLERTFSPSEIEDFFRCQKMYYFKRILGMKTEETDDVFTVISPITVGNLIHELMDRLSGTAMSREEFLAEAEKSFDTYLLSRPPINETETGRMRRTFLSIAGNGYDSDPGNEIIYSEEELTVAHPSGITLKGRLDRAEKTPDGRLIIVDYKSGSKIRHEENDVVSCLQILLYASMLKHRGIEVSGGEYRYLRFDRTVKCGYDPSAEKTLSLLLSMFAESVENGKFEANGDCKYCDFKRICRKEDKKNA